MKKITQTICFAAIISLLASCSPKTESGGNKENVKISFYNSKAEIQTALEDIAKEYGALKGVEVELLATQTGMSPFERISSLYNSGNPPTISMLDTTDINQLAKEKALDLSNEKWVADAKDLVHKIDGKVYSFPFCVEGRGIIYNKNTIEKTLGQTFDASTIQSYNDLKEIFDKLRAAGMENPMVLSKEDWSLGAHVLQLVYETQTGTQEGTDGFIKSLKNGSVNLIENKRFNELMDTFDLLMEYNINKADPLAAVYDNDPIFLADGEAAFWFNGNWAWPNIVEAGGEKDDYGIIPYVAGNDKTDFANTQLQAGPTKQAMIDKIKATEAQQTAAKDLLNWFVYDSEGQRALVEKMNLVPAFTNIDVLPTDPISKAISSFTERGDIFPQAIVPGDHWSILGASMQQYLAGKMTRSQLAAKIEDYWRSQS